MLLWNGSSHVREFAAVPGWKGLRINRRAFGIERKYEVPVYTNINVLDECVVHGCGNPCRGTIFVKPFVKG